MAELETNYFIMELSINYVDDILSVYCTIMLIIYNDLIIVQ